MALPLAMMMLVSLMALMLAFSVLAQHEPTIAANHSHAQQALQMANSGIERALWALANPTDLSGIPTATQTALLPYDGSNYFTLGSTGGFTVAVVAGANSSERVVTSIGWSPSNTAANRAHRKVQVIALAPPPPLNPPCAICVAGSTQIGGSAVIDSRNGACSGGTAPVNAVRSSGTTSTAGNAFDIYGAGDNIKNTSGVDYVSGADSGQFLYNQSNIDALKAIAKTNGTYFQGPQSSIPTTGGVIFIDTVDGSNYTGSTSDSNAGSLTLNGNSTYLGIIVVAGTVTLSGNATFNGLVYSLNDISITGNVTVNGAIASENRKDTSSTNIDSSATGSVHVNYSCDNVASGGGTVTLPTSWTIKSQTYAEQSGS